jgi:hypothetical protein
VDALTSRLSTRFLVVTVVPNILLIGYAGLLVAAGAPTRSPSPARALAVLDKLTAIQVIALFLGVLIFSVATYPLQTPLIQLIEGYWQGLPFGPAMAERCTDRFRQELNWVRAELNQKRNEDDWDWAARQANAHAKYRQNWLPTLEQDLLPTVLGNTLVTGEIRACRRYGLETDVTLPRLAPLLSPGSLAELRERRNQLDATVRLCVAAGLATASSVCLLLRYGPWLFLALATYLLCWGCYRAAVAAARGFCDSLAAAVDLHHLQLYDALQLQRPADLAEEFNRSEVLTYLFRGEVLDEDQMAQLRYLPPNADGSTGGGGLSQPQLPDLPGP